MLCCREMQLALLHKDRRKVRAPHTHSSFLLFVSRCCWIGLDWIAGHAACDVLSGSKGLKSVIGSKRVTPLGKRQFGHKKIYRRKKRDSALNAYRIGESAFTPVLVSTVAGCPRSKRSQPILPTLAFDFFFPRCD